MNQSNNLIDEDALTLKLSGTIYYLGNDGNWYIKDKDGNYIKYIGPIIKIP